jgi:hypothetical protein
LQNKSHQSYLAISQQRAMFGGVQTTCKHAPSLAGESRKSIRCFGQIERGQSDACCTMEVSPGTTHRFSLEGIFMQMRNRSLLALVFVTMLLQACNQQVDTAKIQADVAKAEADGQKKIIDAQAKLDQVVAQNNKDVVGVQADAQKDATNNPNAAPAAASTDIDKARTNAENKVADAQFDVDKAKAEAAEQIAETRCGLQVGDANKACMSSARVAYDSAVATAKAKSDAAHTAH